MEYIAFDAHKRYTLASVAQPDGRLVREQRIPHERGALQQFLEQCEQGSPVAVETIGNWYWIVDEIEAAGCVPKLVHARKAKLMMGEINKTDRLVANTFVEDSTMASCDTCKNEFTGDVPFCKPECHPGFGKGNRHPGTWRFPGRTAARRRSRRARR